MICEQCRSEIPGESAFCLKCGERVHLPVGLRIWRDLVTVALALKPIFVKMKLVNPVLHTVEPEKAAL
jgi:hypothetical protein